MALHATMKYLAFKQLIKQINNVTSEIHLHIGDSITSRAVDTSNTIMVEVELPPSSFEQYKCDKPIDVAIDVSRILPFLNLTYGFVTIDIREDSVNLSSGKFSLNMATLDKNTIKKEPNSPPLEFTGSSTVEAVKLRGYIKEANKFGDKVRVTICEYGNLITEILTLDDDSNELIFTIDNGFTGENGEVSSLYSIELIKDAINHTTGIIDIEMSTDHPIKLGTKIGEFGKVNYLIAPRIEN